MQPLFEHVSRYTCGTEACSNAKFRRKRSVGVLKQLGMYSTLFAFIKYVILNFSSSPSLKQLLRIPFILMIRNTGHD